MEIGTNGEYEDDSKDERFNRLIKEIHKALDDIHDVIYERSLEAAKKIAEESIPSRITITFKDLCVDGIDYVIDEFQMSFLQDIVPMDLAEMLTEGLGRKDRLIGFLDCSNVDIRINSKDLSIEKLLESNDE